MILASSRFGNDTCTRQLIGKALSALYARPHDGHTWYSKPRCYGVTFLQPFDLYSFVTGGTQKIGILGINSRLGDQNTVQNAFQSLYGFDPSIYVGWEIETIDGVTALTAIKNYARFERLHKFDLIEKVMEDHHVMRKFDSIWL